MYRCHTPQNPSASISLVTTLTLSLYSSCSCACAMLASIQVMAWLVLLALTPTIPPVAEREVITNMLHRLPVYSVTGRGPFQGYYSPCSGRHYCLRGMDYYVDGGPAIRRHLHTLGERAVRLGWDGMGLDRLPWVGWG